MFRILFINCLLIYKVLAQTDSVEVNNLLNDLESLINTKVQLFRDKLPILIKNFDKAVRQYQTTTQTEVNREYSKILSSINKLELKCDEGIKTNITNLREAANVFYSCSNFLSNTVARYLGTTDNLVNAVKEEFKVLKENIVECKDNNGCIDEYKKKLDDALQIMPKKITELIKDAEKYVEDAKERRLQTCSSTVEMIEKGKELIDYIKKHCLN